ncbi:transcobalamin-1-like [Scyliorhinus torazame]|uniref:transcobalamin-1-like n=1 Tax=Scyliorhinus torazame TaxID=75743 RepID=UPI003B5A4476
MSRLCSLLLLLICWLTSCHPAVGDSTPKSQRETVTSLLRTLLRSVKVGDFNPNPNVHIALRLARDHNLETEELLLMQLKEASVRKVLNSENFSSGLVALYTLAVKASCNDPINVTANGTTIDLIGILQEKLTQEIKHIEATGFPLSNYYQVSLDMLALCVMNSHVSPCSVRILTRAVDEEQFTHGSEFSVDTGSVAALALRCVKQAGTIQNTVNIEDALRKVLTQILEHVKDDGLIGNLYSTGEAMQVDNLTLPETSTTLAPVTSAVPIRVEYNIEDGVNHTFSDAVNVTVPRGSRLIQVLEETQRLYPVRFSFDVTMTLWGPSLTIVRGLSSSNQDRTYWQLLNGSRPLDQGIGDYRPQNGEHIFARLTHY